MTVARQTSWKELNLLARCYLDFQHARISIEHRIRLMLEAVLIEAGLMEEIKITQKPNSKGKIKSKYERRLIVIEPATDDPEDIEMAEAETQAIIEQANQIERDLPNQSEPYAIMLQRASELRADEKETLETCKRLMHGTELWNWIERVKGLADVAAMTLLGYINPDRVKGVEQVWKYFGLYPKAKLISGQKANFNLELKGRMYLLARNLIMQKDPYYEKIYRLKKEYYYQIDEIKEEWLTKPGGKMHIDMSAKIAMVKLAVSHAVQIILTSNGKPFLSKHENNRYMPPKPIDVEEMNRFLTLYESDIPEKITRRNNRYAEEKKDAAALGITVEELRERREKEREGKDKK